jgi:hypothetical protein
MQKVRHLMKHRPVAWFFAISVGIELVIVGVFLLSSATDKLEAAIRTRASKIGRTSSRLAASW